MIAGELPLCLREFSWFKRRTLRVWEASQVLGKFSGWVWWGVIPNHLTLRHSTTQQTYCLAVLRVMRDCLVN